MVRLCAGAEVQCHACQARVASYDVIHFGSIEAGYRDLCSRCFNKEVAGLDPFELEQVSFQPIDMSDAAGRTHRFHFLLLLLGDRATLEAFEVQDGERCGYEFRILGDPQADLFELMARLVGRMRRALSLTHLVDEGPQWSIADKTTPTGLRNRRATVKPTRSEWELSSAIAASSSAQIKRPAPRSQHGVRCA